MFTFAFITFSSADCMAGQISVINPSSGSEASGVVMISPQPSTSQGGSGQPNSNSSSFLNEGSYTSTKYIIFKNLESESIRINIYFKRIVTKIRNKLAYK